jgi:hypothetical protein
MLTAMAASLPAIWGTCLQSPRASQWQTGRAHVGVSHDRLRRFLVPWQISALKLPAIGADVSKELPAGA